MEYLVSLGQGAAQDLENIYQCVGAESGEAALAWFNGLVEAIHSLERFPEKGEIFPAGKVVRQLPFGKNPHICRIIYSMDYRNRAVNVVCIWRNARRMQREPNLTGGIPDNGKQSHENHRVRH
jgi:plasmid stabilization system protein ParE